MWLRTLAARACAALRGFDRHGRRPNWEACSSFQSRDRCQGPLVEEATFQKHNCDDRPAVVDL